MYNSRERLLLEASAFLEKAAGFYSGRVEVTLRAKGDTGEAGSGTSPGTGGVSSLLTRWHHIESTPP